jgi:hypothetical protein
VSDDRKKNGDGEKRRPIYEALERSAELRKKQGKGCAVAVGTVGAALVTAVATLRGWA